MSKKILLTVLLFYILTLIQTSFLVHFPILGVIPNSILIVVLLINLLEDPKGNLGVVSALSGGFFLDVFSQKPIGFYILILVFLAFSIKFIIKRHIRIPTIKNI